MVNLSVNLAGVELKNPIIPASGTFGFGNLHRGQYHGCLPLRRGAEGIKVAHHQLRTDSLLPQAGIAAIGGNDKIFRTGRKGQTVVLPRSHNITNRSLHTIHLPQVFYHGGSRIVKSGPVPPCFPPRNMID